MGGQNNLHCPPVSPSGPSAPKGVRGQSPRSADIRLHKIVTEQTLASRPCARPRASGLIKPRNAAQGPGCPPRADCYPMCCLPPPFSNENRVSQAWASLRTLPPSVPDLWHLSPECGAPALASPACHSIRKAVCRSPRRALPPSFLKVFTLPCWRVCGMSQSPSSCWGDPRRLVPQNVSPLICSARLRQRSHGGRVFLVETHSRAVPAAD